MTYYLNTGNTGVSIMRIEKNQQDFNATDILSIWSGITICLPAFMLGGILVPSLSFSTAILVTLAGNLILVFLIFLMALPGLKYGYSSAYLNRYIFGYPAGHIIPSIIVILSMVGWAAILLDLAGHATYEILKIYVSDFPVEMLVVIIGSLITFTSFAGHNKIRTISKFNLPSLIIITIWLLFILIKDYNVNNLLSYKPTYDLNIITGLDIVIGGTIAGAFVSSDLCRFAKNKKVLGSGLFWGIIPAAFFLAIIGMFSQLMTGSWNPVQIIGKLGMGVPALILVIISTWTTIQVSIYSGSLALNNILPVITRKKAAVILGIILISFAIMNIMQFFEQWLLLLDNVFAPMIAITLVRYFFHKEELMKYKNVQWTSFIPVFISIYLTRFLPLPVPSTLLAIFWTFLFYFFIR